jgi:hypothetical protein
MARGGIVRNLAGLGAAGGLAAAGAINAAGGPACDAERRTGQFIGAAAQRVERHLFGENSDEHLDPDALSALQSLAVKVVVGEYWPTQRFKTARVAGGSSGPSKARGPREPDPTNRRSPRGGPHRRVARDSRWLLVAPLEASR